MLVPDLSKRGKRNKHDFPPDRGGEGGKEQWQEGGRRGGGGEAAGIGKRNGRAFMSSLGSFFDLVA